MSAKPVVYFSGTATIIRWVWNFERIVASIPSVQNHPHLGREYDVRTSMIVSVAEDMKSFETRNTTYRAIDDASIVEIADGISIDDIKKQAEIFS